MIDRASESFHTVGEEWLAAYSAGALSPSKSMVIACQAALEPRLAERLASLDHVGGVVLERSEGEALSAGFLDGVLNGLDAEPASAAPARASHTADSPDWAPSPLRDLIHESGSSLKWRTVGPGVARAPLFEDESGERLYLLRARGGSKLATHSHRGEEWTLILQGGYHVGDQGYVAGDLHREDESCTHQPIIDDDGPCISLVAIEGKLRFNHPLLKALQPFVGV